MLRNSTTVLTGLALLMLGTAPVQAASREQVVTGTSKWVVDWRPQYCVVQRIFGSDGQSMYFQMNQYGPGDRFEFALTGKALRPFVNGDTVGVSFGKDGPPKEVRFQRADSDEYGPGMIFSTSYRVSAHEGDTAATGMPADVDRIILHRGKRRLVIGTGPLKGVMAAANKCASDLVSTWGLDPAVQATLSRNASAQDLGALAKAVQQHYPPALAGRGKQARVNIHALIGADGAVTDCSVQQSYNDPKFDGLACKEVQKFLFDPALDAQGNPVASYWNTTIIYSMG